MKYDKYSNLQMIAAYRSSKKRKRHGNAPLPSRYTRDDDRRIDRDGNIRITR